jgi:serine/threonine-protein kinase
MGVLAQEIEATYEVLSKMGEGGMGAVYKVRHRFFDEIRVVKVMQADLELLPELKERFLGEAKRGKQLRHPNLAEVIDFSIASDGTSYIVMEFVDGVNLREVLTRNDGPLDYKTVVPIAEQVLAALGFLHSRKFVHRDISPDNIMLMHEEGDAEPRVKLIDLGIAKSLESTRQLTMAGKFVGKVLYASPEQFSGEVDGRSDLYALGVVLYELLTNAKPVTGDNPMSIIGGHLSRPPRAFEETDPGNRVPGPLRAAILKALEKVPDNRYANAAEFAEALRNTIPAGDRRTMEVPVITSPAVSMTGEPRLGERPAGTAQAVTVPGGGTIPPVVSPRRVDVTSGIEWPPPAPVVVPPPAPVTAPRRWSVIAAVVALVLAIGLAAIWSKRNSVGQGGGTTASNTMVAPPIVETSGTTMTVAAVEEPGQLLINALPWGEVTSVRDGHGVERLLSGPAETPLMLALPPGRYTVSLTNPNSNTSVQLDATVKAGALTRYEAELDRIDAEKYVDGIGLGQ